MMSVIWSSHGSQWTFYAAAGDKVFLVENKRASDEEMPAAISHMIREARFLFGDKRMIVLTKDDDWVEVLHDGAGHIMGFEAYEGPVPEQEEAQL
jgi:hypothetical protein